MSESREATTKEWTYSDGLIEWESGGLDEVPTELIYEYAKAALRELAHRDYEELHDIFNEI